MAFDLLLPQSFKKMIKKILMIAVLLGTCSQSYSHTFPDEQFLPNTDYLECKKNNDKQVCKENHPIGYRGLITLKYLSIDVATENHLCINVKKYGQRKSNVALNTVFGSLSLYLFAGEPSKVKSIDIHVHKNQETVLCSGKLGFLVDVGPEFYEAWKNADDKNRYEFLEVWVSYERK